MTTMGRVALTLGALAALLLPIGCASRQVEPPPRAAAVPTAPASAPPPAAPSWPDAAPVPSDPALDAAGPAPTPEHMTEFTGREELQDVHFAPGQVHVQRADQKALDAAAVWLKANPDHLVILEGHTDVVGPRAANLALAQRRAKWVMDYLVARGVPASRITVVSRGEGGILCADKSTACQGRNRRVHFLVRESGPLQISASPNP
jgi:outer membrane protein OmpA-like peptidoglycan-associated protein